MSAQVMTQEKSQIVQAKKPVGGILQRKCACGQHTIAGGECEECRKKRGEIVQHTLVRAAPVNTILQHNLQSSLDETPTNTVSHFECDFSQVRTHTAREKSQFLVAATKSLFPTDEGTETQSAADGEALAPSPSPATPLAASGCSVTGAFSNIPNGQTLLATLRGSKLTREFNMIGEFIPSIPCTCSCGEYRQYVRGTFTRNGANVVHALCGTNLDPTTYQEDCARLGGTDYKYGYRSNPFGTSKFVNPDQATGCQFQGHDSPGISGSSGDSLAMNLDFRGQLVDTCNGSNVLATAEWSVGGAATVP